LYSGIVVLTTLCCVLSGDKVEAQQGVQARCFAELDAFSRFLATTAALKYGTWVLVLISV
jgi:hypothetical protein